MTDLFVSYISKPKGGGMNFYTTILKDHYAPRRKSEINGLNEYIREKENINFSSEVMIISWQELKDER